MAERLALLVDDDNHFASFLHASLSPYGFSVEAIEDGAIALEQVEARNPELLFIAVELPDKAGYALCNKAKKGPARQIPVVLATSSVPSADLDKHKKLRVHADEYMDKRSVTPEELLARIGALIDLGPRADAGLELAVDADDLDVEEVELSVDDSELDVEEFDFDDLEEEVAVEAAPAQPGYADSDETRVSSHAFAVGLDQTPEPAPAFLDHDGLDLGLDVVAEQADHTPRGQAGSSSARVLELEGEVEALNQQLLDAKRGGTDAKFTREREFLNLREVINKKEKEIISLKEDLDRQEQEALAVKKQIRELERQHSGGEERLLTIEGQLVGANETIAEQRRKIEAQNQRLAQGEAREAQIEAGHRAQLQAAEEAKDQALFQLQEQLDEDSAQALAAANAAHEQRVAGIERQHGEAMARFRAEQEEAVERKDRELKVALRRFDDAKQQALEEQENRLAVEKEQALEAAENRRQIELDELESRYQAEVTALQETHAAEVEKLRAEVSKVSESLAGTKAKIGELQEEVAGTRNTIGDREREIEGYQRDLVERDDHVNKLRGDVHALELQIGDFQEQVQKAYQRIKADETTVDKAKKALAIALTLLDEQLGESDGDEATE